MISNLLNIIYSIAQNFVLGWLYGGKLRGGGGGGGPLLNMFVHLR